MRRPCRARMRFSPRSGTRSATVPRATRSRWSRSLKSKATGMFSARSRFSRPCISLKTRPTVQRCRQGSSAPPAFGRTWGLIRMPAVQRPVLRAVVVDHDDVDALRLEVGDLLVGIGPAVERDEQVRLALLQRAVDRAARKAVAVLRAARHDEARVEPEAPQHEHQERRARHPVDVVVAEDGHLLAARDGRRAAASAAGSTLGTQERVRQLRAAPGAGTRGRVGSRVARRAAAAPPGRGLRPRARLSSATSSAAMRRVDPAHGPIAQDYREALLAPVHSYFGATSACASTCLRSPLCHQ